MGSDHENATAFTPEEGGARDGGEGEAARTAGTTTERQIERSYEDRRYLPVILKRNDVSVRHPDDILQHAIEEGVRQSTRPVISLFLSAISAGAILAFTAFSVGLMTDYSMTVDSPLGERLLVALVYPLGFVLCLVSGTQLFTEHTALAVYPVLDRMCSVWAMVRVWAMVLGGNLVGCAIGSGLMAAANGVIDAGPGYAAVATHLISFAPADILLSSVVAGWLMALGGWLMMATPPDVSQIVVIYMVTFLIGLGGLHHSIAGSAEILVAAWTGTEIGTIRAAWVIGAMSAGNLAGGALFVAVLNYGHIRKTESSRREKG